MRFFGKSGAAWGAALSITASFAAFGCGCAPSTTPASPPRAQPSSRGASSPAEVVVAVARNVDLFGPHGGGVIAHVDRADVLGIDEAPPVRMVTTAGVVEGHMVRLRTTSGIVTGYVKRVDERVGEGIGSFVATDTDVHANDGTSLVAKLHRGAFVPLRERHGEDVVVALNPFGQTGHAPVSALTQEPLPPPPSASPGGKLVQRRHLILQMYGSPGTTLNTTCDAPIALFEETPDGVRASQTIAGVEIVGLATDEGEPCPARVIVRPRPKEAPPDIPAPYVAVVPSDLTLLTRARSLYLVDHKATDGGPQCSKWTLQNGKKGRELAVTTSYRPFNEGDLLRDHTVFSIEAEPSLTHAPTNVILMMVSDDVRDSKGQHPAGLGEGWSGDVWSPAILGETPEGLVVLDGVSAQRLLAYHPDDADIWYRDRSRCEAAVAKERAGWASPQHPTLTERILAPRPANGG